MYGTTEGYQRNQTGPKEAAPPEDTPPEIVVYQMALGDASTTQKKPPMLGVISAIITPRPSAGILDTRHDGGNSTTITIADRCPVCRGYGLDLSHAVFDAIGDQAAKRVTPLQMQLT